MEFKNGTIAADSHVAHGPDDFTSPCRLASGETRSRTSSGSSVGVAWLRFWAT